MFAAYTACEDKWRNIGVDEWLRRAPPRHDGGEALFAVVSVQSSGSREEPVIYYFPNCLRANWGVLKFCFGECYYYDLPHNAMEHEEG